MYTDHAGFPLRARYTAARYESRRNDRAYKGEWNLRMYTRQSKHEMRFGGQVDNLPFPLPLALSHLPLRRINSCEYQELPPILFDSLVRENDKYWTHGARYHCLRRFVVGFFFFFAQGMGIAAGLYTSLDTARLERENRVSTWLIARARFPVHLRIHRTWYGDMLIHRCIDFEI